MRRRLAGVAAVLLLVLSVMMIAGHLRPDHNTQSLLLPASEAARRAKETMKPQWPLGDIDPNTAGVDELTALEGIGPAMARRIVEERERNGAFRFPEDLLSVSGIGSKTLQKLWQQLSLPPIY